MPPWTPAQYSPVGEAPREQRIFLSTQSIGGTGIDYYCVSPFPSIADIDCATCLDPYRGILYLMWHFLRRRILNASFVLVSGRVKVLFIL